MRYAKTAEVYRPRTLFSLTKLSFVFWALVFRAVLDLSYLQFVNPLFLYSGFEKGGTTNTIIESWLLFTTIVCFLPFKINKPSDFFVCVFFFGLFAPLLSLYGLSSYPQEYLYLQIFSFVLVLFFRNGNPIKIPVIKNGRYFLLILLYVIVFFVISWLIYAGGSSQFNLHFKDVYSFRESSKETVDLGIMGYINPTTFKAALPTLLVFFLWKKKFLLALLTCSVFVFCFGMSSHKAVLFYPLLILFIWLFVDTNKKLQLLPMALTVLVLICLGLYIFVGNIVVPSLFIRRSLFVIADNSFDYYEYFNNLPPLLWSNSITSQFIEYPYHVSPAKLIGEWRGTASYVNTSFVGTGYAHAGIYGIVLYGLLTGFLLRLIDSFATVNLPMWVVVGITVIPIQALFFSTDFPTAFLTHGMLLSILILFFLRQARFHVPVEKNPVSSCAKERS